MMYFFERTKLAGTRKITLYYICFDALGKETWVEPL